MPPYPFLESSTEVTVTSAYVGILMEDPTQTLGMVPEIKAYVHCKPIPFKEWLEKGFASNDKGGAMQSTETSEWGFKSNDVTTGTPMQMKEVVGKRKGLTRWRGKRVEERWQGPCLWSPK